MGLAVKICLTPSSEADAQAVQRVFGSHPSDELITFRNVSATVLSAGLGSNEYNSNLGGTSQFYSAKVTVR